MKTEFHIIFLFITGFFLSQCGSGTLRLAPVDAEGAAGDTQILPDATPPIEYDPGTAATDDGDVVIVDDVSGDIPAAGGGEIVEDIEKEEDAAAEDDGSADEDTGSDGTDTDDDGSSYPGDTDEDLPDPIKPGDRDDPMTCSPKLSPNDKDCDGIKNDSDLCPDTSDDWMIFKLEFLTDTQNSCSKDQIYAKIVVNGSTMLDWLCVPQTSLDTEAKVLSTSKDLYDWATMGLTTSYVLTDNWADITDFTLASNYTAELADCQEGTTNMFGATSTRILSKQKQTFCQTLQRDSDEDGTGDNCDGPIVNSTIPDTTKGPGDTTSGTKIDTTSAVPADLNTINGGKNDNNGKPPSGRIEDMAASPHYALNDGYIFWRGSKLDWEYDQAHEIDEISSFIKDQSTSNLSTTIGLSANLDLDYSMYGEAEEKYDWQMFYTGVAFDDSTARIVKSGEITKTCDTYGSNCTGSQAVTISPLDGNFQYYVVLDGVDFDAYESMGCEDLNVKASLASHTPSGGQLTIDYTADFNGPEATNQYIIRIKYAIFAVDREVWGVKKFDNADSFDKSGNVYSADLNLDLSDVAVKPSGKEQAFIGMTGWGFEENLNGVCEVDSVYAKAQIDSISDTQASLKIEGAVAGYIGSSADFPSQSLRPNVVEGYLFYCNDANICQSSQTQRSSDSVEDSTGISDLSFSLD